jgi:hypothetical protein
MKCEGCGSPGKTRTCDKSVNSRLLYQLSYRGTGADAPAGVGYSKCITVLPMGISLFVICIPRHYLIGVSGTIASHPELLMEQGPPKIRIGKNNYPLPASRIARTAIGLALIVFGIFGFLPVLGFWMIPLGFIVLSLDWAVARRARRRFSVWFTRRWNGWRSEQ